MTLDKTLGSSLTLKQKGQADVVDAQGNYFLIVLIIQEVGTPVGVMSEYLRFVKRSKKQSQVKGLGNV